MTAQKIKSILGSVGAAAVIVVSLIAIVYGIATLRTVTSAYDQVNHMGTTLAQVGAPIANHFHGACVLDDGATNGKVFINPAEQYRLCVPDGWQLFSTTDGTAKGIARDPMDILIGDRLAYTAGVYPEVGYTGGKDGIFEFELFFDAKSIDTPEGFKQTGSFKALTQSGIVYRRTEPATGSSNEGLGGIPAGTQMTEYVLQNKGRSLNVSYNRLPDTSDNSKLMRLVAQSLDFIK